MGFESLPERFNLISVTPSSIKTVLKRKERLSTRYLAFQFSWVPELNHIANGIPIYELSITVGSETVFIVRSFEISFMCKSYKLKFKTFDPSAK